MYFNNKKETDINHEFKNKKNILSIITKYKVPIVVTILIILIIITILITSSKERITNYLELNGAKTMKIHLGSDYIEPGYNAYNSKDEDLTNKVTIKSNLNTDKIGEYEITYTIEDITKTRKIIVIEKDQEQTFIHLTPVNNDVNIYLKVGEEYKEPGYTVFSTSNENLTEKVKVLGTVDTNTKGSYKLIYILITEEDATISATRTVIVMDTEIFLTLSNEKYTKNNVLINVDIIDDYFDYMILPDNTKINATKHSYQVTKNGKYTFTTYNKKGNSKSQTIEVINIDKTPPTGSCSGSYKNGVTTINISSKDNIGIEKYVLNGITYTKNDITINKELITANIKIYDKAENYITISCNLVNKNEQLNTTSPNSSSSPVNPNSESQNNSNSGNKPPTNQKPNNNSNSNIFIGTKYNLTESQLKSIAMLCQKEQTSAIASAAEASLMANRFELHGSKFGTGANGLYNYIRNSGWWGGSKKHMDNVSGLNATVLSAVRDVLVNGNRTLPKYINEHDCISCGKYGYDIVKIITNGKTITNKTELLNRSNYIKDNTIIYNKYGTIYTFYSFPDEKSDPFGYTAYAKKNAS